MSTSVKTNLHLMQISCSGVGESFEKSRNKNVATHSGNMSF